MHISMFDPSAFTIPYDIHLCKGLARAGAKVKLVTRKVRTADYYSLEKRNWQYGNGEFTIVEKFYPASEGWPLLTRVRPIKSLLKALEHAVGMSSELQSLRKTPPGIVHFQWMVLPLLDQMFIRRIRLFAPTVMTVHDTAGFNAPTSRLQRLDWLSTLSEFDRIIVHTRSAKKILIEQGLETEKIAVVPHGVLRYGENESQLGCEVKSERLSVLTFGAIKHYKGVDILIRAFAHLSEAERSQVRLVVAGMPSMPETELRSLAVELGVDGYIEWHLRFILDEEVADFFRNCDVVVFPYRQIDASGALMTALPFGKAIVASRIGVFSEQLTDGEDALLVEPGDPQGLAESMRLLLRDRELARRLGRRSATLADDTFSWERIAQLTMEVYSDAEARHKLESGLKMNLQA